MNGIFSDAGRVAMVPLIDKKTDNKNKISNYSSVSVLNIFSKIYEIALKSKLASAFSDYMSPFILSYKEWYST